MKFTYSKRTLLKPFALPDNFPAIAQGSVFYIVPDLNNQHPNPIFFHPHSHHVYPFKISHDYVTYQHLTSISKPLTFDLFDWCLFSLAPPERNHHCHVCMDLALKFSKILEPILKTPDILPSLLGIDSHLDTLIKDLLAYPVPSPISFPPVLTTIDKPESSSS